MTRLAAVVKIAETSLKKANKLLREGWQLLMICPPKHESDDGKVLYVLGRMAPDVDLETGVGGGIDAFGDATVKTTQCPFSATGSVLDTGESHARARRESNSGSAAFDPGADEGH